MVYNIRYVIFNIKKKTKKSFLKRKKNGQKDKIKTT